MENQAILLKFTSIMRALWVALFVQVAAVLSAQEPTISGGNENGTTLNVLYRHDASGKIYASTRGWGVTFRRGKHVTQKTRSFWEIELQNLKHPKETKSVGDGEHKRRYVYGKINNVTVLRGAIGLQNVLFSKADLKAVEVRYAYSLGPTLAFAKPYYVRVYSSQPELGEVDVMFNSEAYSPDSGRVQGRSDFAVGLNQLKVYPGITGKFNLSFEYAPYTNLIRAIETGICVDYFPKALPILNENPAENFIITFHVGFVFGRKWF